MDDHSDRMNRAALSLGVSLIVVFDLDLEQAEALAKTFRDAANKALERNEDAIADTEPPEGYHFTESSPEVAVRNKPEGSGERCNCATYGNAHLCPVHTQTDFEAAARRGNREPGNV